MLALFQNVEVEVSSQEYAGNKYYEQYNSASGCFKLGEKDFYFSEGSFKSTNFKAFTCNSGNYHS